MLVQVSHHRCPGEVSAPPPVLRSRPSATLGAGDSKRLPFSAPTSRRMDLHLIAEIENTLIGVLYLAIAAMLAVAIGRDRRLGRHNLLGLTVCGIFLTCSLGHFGHAFLQHAVGEGRFPDRAGAITQAIADGTTVVVAIVFFALRRRYPLLAEGEPVLEELRGRIQAQEAALREQELVLRAQRNLHALRQGTVLSLGKPWHYGLALLLFGAVLTLKLHVGALGTQAPYLLFLGAVMVAAYVGGIGPSVLVSVLTLVAVWYYFQPVSRSFVIADPASFLIMQGAFAGQALLFLALEAQRRRAIGAQRHVLTLVAEAERNRAEMEATRAQVAAAEVRARDEFLSVASHEIRTPLTTLRAHLQLLERKLAERDGRSRQHVDIALAQVDRINRLVGDLSTVGHIGRGDLILAPRLVNLSALVDELIEERTTTSANHQITVQRAGADVDAVCDPHRIEQVVTNLVDNAVKYSPQGGEVTVTVEQNDATACVTVCDQGIGLPDDTATIFERFERARNVCDIPGFGVGLFISKAIVDAHGGAIEAYPNPAGQGACFTVRLPRTVPDGPTAIAT